MAGASIVVTAYPSKKTSTSLTDKSGHFSTKPIKIQPSIDSHEGQILGYGLDITADGKTYKGVGEAPNEIVRDSDTGSFRSDSLVKDGPERFNITCSLDEWAEAHTGTFFYCAVPR